MNEIFPLLALPAIPNQPDSALPALVRPIPNLPLPRPNPNPPPLDQHITNSPPPWAPPTSALLDPHIPDSSFPQPLPSQHDVKPSPACEPRHIVLFERFAIYEFPRNMLSRILERYTSLPWC